MDEDVRALVREYLDLHRREVEALEASVRLRNRAMGWRLWFPLLTLGVFLGLIFWLTHR